MRLAATERGDNIVRTGMVLAADLVSWPLAFVVASRVDNWTLNARVGQLIAVAVVAQLVLGCCNHLYRRRFQPMSFEEFSLLGLTVAAAGSIDIVVDRWLSGGQALGHRGVLATACAAWLCVSHRFFILLRARYVSHKLVAERQPVLVLGAGEGGYRAVRAMLYSAQSPYKPVALLDDDPVKSNTRISRVRVCGNSAEMDSVAKQYGATAVVLALPSADASTLQRLYALATKAGLETLVLPPVQRLVGAGSTAEITRYSDEDVLRRQIVDIDLDAVRAMVEGECVAVTGAGGSIGSELARQLASFAPACLLLIDHDDSLLHATEQSIPQDQQGPCQFTLADIRDGVRLDQLFTEHRPRMVFHAAALKHVPVLERFPSEGWKTNVVGTGNVLAAATRTGVERFVNISTDKAAAPANVLGLTKRIAERITAHAAIETGCDFVSVRFGNVIGSRGSVLETFERQIANGGPVTVTHPDVTRYFMSVREAVRLTLQAAAIGCGGEVMVLDMGSPVRIVDVAKQLIEQRGGGIEIVFTGLRPGEKMTEVLLSEGESARRHKHPMIDHVDVPSLDLAAAFSATYQAKFGSGLVDPMTLGELRVLAEFRAPAVSPAPAEQQSTDDRLGGYDRSVVHSAAVVERAQL